MSVMEYSKEIAIWNPRKWRRHRCKVCKFKTASMFFMANHAKRHELGLAPYNNCETSPVEMYFCKDCNFTTDMAVDLKAHITACHFEQKEVTTANQIYTCRDCDFATYSSLNLYKHVLSENCDGINKNCESMKDEIQRFKCHKCDYKGKFQSYLKLHIKLKHRADSEIDWFQCHECKFKSKYKGNLKMHTLTKHLRDHEIEWFYCDVCEFKTKYKRALRTHIQCRHTGEIQWFQCDKCEFRTKYKSTLRSHINCRHNLRSHIEDKHSEDNKNEWFRCDKCEYRAKHKATLRKHIGRKHLEDDVIEWVQLHLKIAQSKRTLTKR